MIFDRFPNIVYRASQVSDGNMSYATGDPKEALSNRKEFAKNIGTDSNQIASVKQVHGNLVKRVLKSDLDHNHNPAADLCEADALITSEAGVYLLIKTADCIPISIYDPDKNAIALIHAGRAGLEKGVISKTILELENNFGSRAKDLLVFIGPSIGPCCYGPFFKDKTPAKLQKYLTDHSGEFKLDIWRLAEDQLQNSGVLKKNIENSKTCTYHNPEYFSYRRSKDRQKSDNLRFATILGMQKN